MADGIVKAAVDKLEELALQELKLQSQVGKKVRELKDELDWLRAFLGHADQRRRQEVNEYMEVWVRQTRDVAFDAEDLLEEYFVKGRLHCHSVLDLPSFLRWLRRSVSGLFVRHSICDHIEEMKKRLADIKDKRDNYNLQNLPTTWAPPQRHYAEWSTFNDWITEENIVGVTSHYREVSRFLSPSVKGRTILAITGTNGIGKTTIASLSYKRYFVKERFDCTIWVNVPQKAKLVDLLNDVLEQATGVPASKNKLKDENKIMKKLTEILSMKKYLIVLDDVRNLEEWRFFLAMLPDNGETENRVVIITQIKPPGILGNSTGSLCHQHLEIKKLAVDEGKELFCRRVFGGKAFPLDFWNKDYHSKNIENLMDGSPLRITLLAGLLRSKTEDEWANVINQLQCFSNEKSTTPKNLEKQQGQEQQRRQEQQQEVKQTREQQILKQGKKEQQQKQEEQQQKEEQREVNKWQLEQLQQNGQEEQQQSKEEEEQEEQRQENKQQSEQLQQGQQEEKKKQQVQPLKKQQQEGQQAKEGKPHRASIQYKQLSLTDKILSLSFDNLPPYLKQCFLYFAAFRAEICIHCSKLIQLWIAEGFVQPADRSTMEECGQEYIKTLISRCLINLVEMDYNDNIVTISIHERVLAFARQEARDTNFLQVRSSSTNLTKTSIRRLSLQSAFDPHTSLNLAVPKLRSLLCDFEQATTDDPSNSSPPICLSNTRNLWKKATEIITGHVDNFTIYQCKFLRVIDLKGVAHFSNLPKDIGCLIHLRYLGLARCSLVSLPDSVKNLCNLQTLDITETKIDAVPHEFWKIQALRHVLTKNLKNGPNEVSVLRNLQTLLGVSWGQWAKNGTLKRLTNLRSLKVLSCEEDSEDLLSALSSLENLTSLELEGAHLPLDDLLNVLALRRLQCLKLHRTTIEATPVAPMQQPDVSMAEQPDAPMEEQPDAPIAEQPDAPMAEQPDAPMAEQPDASMAEQPDAPMAEQPDAPMPGQPDAPTAEQPGASMAEQCHRYLLPNLTKLELDKSNITRIDVIAELPNLALLILGEDSYIGEHMVIPANGFRELRILQLEKLPKLKTWSVPEHCGSALGKLQKISIFNCTELTMILEHLKTNCTELTILEHLKTLEHLVLLAVHYCPKIGDLPHKSEFQQRHKLAIDVRKAQTLAIDVEAPNPLDH